MNRFSEEMKVIPKGAWALAAVVCLGLPIAFVAYAILESQQNMFGIVAPEWFIFLPIFVLFFFYLLLVGYIYGDAKRRGMRAGLWAALAFFIPNMIGIILYFILRSPLL